MQLIALLLYTEQDLPHTHHLYNISLFWLMLAHDHTQIFPDLVGFVHGKPCTKFRNILPLTCARVERSPFSLGCRHPWTHFLYAWLNLSPSLVASAPLTHGFRPAQTQHLLGFLDEGVYLFVVLFPEI